MHFHFSQVLQLTTLEPESATLQRERQAKTGIKRFLGFTLVLR